MDANKRIAEKILDSIVQARNGTLPLLELGVSIRVNLGALDSTFPVEIREPVAQLTGHIRRLRALEAPDIAPIDQAIELLQSYLGLRLYKAIAGEKNSRVIAVAADLTEAKRKLEAVYGVGQIFDLHNEEDANKPR